MCLPRSTGPPSAIFILYLWILKVKLARFDQKTSITIGIHKKAPIARWQLYVEGAKLKIDSSYPKEFLEWDTPDQICLKRSLFLKRTRCVCEMVLFIAAASTLSEKTVFTCLSRFHGSGVFFVDRKAANDMKRLLLRFSRHFFSSPLKEPLPIIKKTISWRYGAKKIAQPGSFELFHE